MMCDRCRERQNVQDGYKTGHGVWSRMLGEEIAHNLNAHVAVGKRKDETRSCEKCRHLERGMYPMAEC